MKYLVILLLIVGCTHIPTNCIKPDLLDCDSEHIDYATLNYDKRYGWCEDNNNEYDCYQGLRLDNKDKIYIGGILKRSGCRNNTCQESSFTIPTTGTDVEIKYAISCGTKKLITNASVKINNSKFRLKELGYRCR